MWKYLLIGILLLQAAGPKPSKEETQGQQQTNTGQVSPTPKIETGNNLNSASQSQQAKQNDETKAFQRTQIRQYWVLVGTSVVTVILLITYTLFAGLQWYWIREQAKRTGDQLGVIKKQSRTMLGTWRVIRQQTKLMQGQLDAVNKQEGHLSVQAEAAKEAADNG